MKWRIIMKNKLQQIICCYIIFYALYSVSTRFVPTTVLWEGPAADILYKSIVIGGGILSLFCLYILRNSRRPDAQTILLGVFILVLGISSLLNYKYELAGNILGLVTFASQLILFYFLPKIMKEDRLMRCLRFTAFLTSFFWNIACAASLWQYIKNIHYTIPNPEGHRIRQGIVDGRLFGLFSDPNFAAFTSLILIMLLLFTIRKTSFFPLKVYCWASIVINTCYIIMSNSRTIFIAAAGTILFTVVLITYRQHLSRGETGMGRFFIQSAKRGLAALAAMIAVYSLIFFPLRQIGQMMEPERAVNDMVREDVDTDNITNNRSTIWKNYLSLYKDKPLFGFSVRSALPYVTDKYPDSYLAETQYVTHNGYLSLLVETGAAGFCVMGAFFLLVFLQSLKKLRQKDTVSENYLFFASLTVSILIFLMCFHDVFFTVNIETMLLYTAVGYLHCTNKGILAGQSA